jgi:hypothetical protein
MSSCPPSRPSTGCRIRTTIVGGGARTICDSAFVLTRDEIRAYRSCSTLLVSFGVDG